MPARNPRAAAAAAAVAIHATASPLGCQGVVKLGGGPVRGPGCLRRALEPARVRPVSAARAGADEAAAAARPAAFRVD